MISSISASFFSIASVAASVSASNRSNASGCGKKTTRASDTVLHFLVLVNQLQLHLHVGEVLVLLLLLLKLLSEPGQPRIEFGKCVDSLLVLPQDLGLVLLIWRQLNKNGWVSRCYMQCAWQLVSSPYHLHRGCSDRVVFRVKRVVKAALDQKEKKCSLWYRVRVCLYCTLFL